MSAPPPKPPKPVKPSADEAEPAADAAAATDEDFVAKGSKNVAELLAKDSEDESLRKYKESLLGSAAHGDLGNVSDPRRLIIEEFRIVFAPEEGVPDVVHQLSTAEGLDALAKDGITMKEGCKFKFRISFRVQHEIVAGIRFVNKMTRMMISDKGKHIRAPPSDLFACVGSVTWCSVCPLLCGLCGVYGWVRDMRVLVYEGWGQPRRS